MYFHECAFVQETHWNGEVTGLWILTPGLRMDRWTLSELRAVLTEGGPTCGPSDLHPDGSPSKPLKRLDYCRPLDKYADAKAL